MKDENQDGIEPLEQSDKTAIIRREGLFPTDMSDTAKMFNDEDFLFLIKLLMPGSTDTPRTIRVLRDDEEILEGMLKDEKLFSYLLENPDSLIKVSPYLFFVALLNRVKYDLEHKAYTLEPGELHPVFVFDSHEVVTLLKDISIRNYLADMLVSFIRINSITIPIRIRKGIWRKLRISDFDIDSLIRYSQMISEHQRFFPYKRIADVCLFT
ncbi:MAG TPA: hypothetical protein VMX75_07610, partial [Spirochaetia bacterium]|nr:hypothetical protein [Spirochaetia bacterium]